MQFDIYRVIFCKINSIARLNLFFIGKIIFLNIQKGQIFDKSYRYFKKLND